MYNKEYIIKIIEEIIESENADLAENDVLKHLEGWDSLAIIGLIAKIDQEYNITIDAEEFTKSETIGDIINLIKNKSDKVD